MNTGPVRVETENGDRIQQGAGAGSVEIPGMSLRDLFRTLRRHLWLVGLYAAAGFAVATVYLHFATPIYEASATLRIDPGRAGSLGFNDLLNGTPSGGDPLKTEAEILKSDAVAIKALNSLPEDLFVRYTGYHKADLAFPSSLSTSSQIDRLNDVAPTLKQKQEGLLNSVEQGLSVKPVADTQILSIGFRDKDPVVAATLVNHVISAYLRSSFESRYGSVAQVQTWLSEQLDTLKQRAAESQRRLAEFQQKNNIIGGTDSNTNTTLDRLRMLNDRLSAAQADRIVKEAQMRAAQTGDVATLATLYPSIGLQGLQGQQATLYSRYAELSSKFGLNYPPLEEVIQERKQVDQQIASLVDTTRNRLHQEYQVAKSTEDLLQQQFSNQTQQVYSLNNKQAEYAVLVAEGSASRDLYDRLQYQLQQAGVTAGLNTVNTMVVNSARTPHTPVEPKRTLIRAFGLIIGLFVGVASAFLISTVADKLHSIAQAETALALPTLATIPHDDIRRIRGPGGSIYLPATYREPSSRMAEGFRNLRNSILLSSIDRPYKVVLITSTLGGEGKSTIVSNYAITLAQSGASVLVVDIDLRRPKLHELFGIANEEGLSDLLMDPGTDHLFQHPLPNVTNVSVLPTGREVSFPSEALASEKFRHLLSKWREQFDFVLLDSAPVMIVSDTLPVAQLADAVVLVTRFDVTPLRGAQRASDTLRRARANIIGIIINDVPADGLDYGTYYGYGYYSDDKKK